jgi:hypothetical protein
MGKFSRLDGFKRPKVFIPLILALLLVAAVVLAIRNMNGPAEGTVTTPLNDDPAVIKGRPSSKSFNDKVISFDYPSEYQVTSSDKVPGRVDVIDLVKTNPHDQSIAISVTEGSLNTDSGVSYRRLHPELYKNVSISPLNQVFSKSDGTEYTGFIQYGGRVIAISLTSVSKKDLSQDYNLIAGSLQWKQ